MERYLGIILLLLIPVSIQAEHKYRTGNDLLRDCEKLVAAKNGFPDLPDEPSAEEMGQLLADNLSAGICLGEIIGQRNAMIYFKKVLPSKAKLCTEDGVEPYQLVNIVMKYLKDRPERLHKPSTDLISKALWKAFPCREIPNVN